MTREISSGRAGSVAVVTGAGSGIGQLTAITLLEAGWRVSLVGRRAEALEETLAAAARFDDALICPADVTDEAAVETAFNRVVVRFGRLDLLFNNAGVFASGDAFEDVAVGDWRRVVDTNLTGVFLCARAAFRQMKAQCPPGGRIINNGSVSAQAPRPRAAAYTASKHAITGLTKAIALEGRAWNIACGQIDIGNAATEMTAGMSTGMLQADGCVAPEPVMGAADVARSILHMASLPLEANVQHMTIIATTMPFIGRG
ncbi:SDR family oxidoreductase [Inquilinus limosus]|uniref:3-oxoacyl-ACP reductase n=1 Tax=Inquilinus limosus TaxID=171674 RepID=A0A211ZEN5_9PROT|nr:SDR family oxidoreductase [Inquilinus limosus]OWJ63752.1 3-oxoacyl-ACP reductase [Inquilinus limosus]